MKQAISTQKLVLLALLTAIVIVLEVFSGLFTVGTFNLTLVLLPVVIGAALVGPWAGAWLGLVFGATVLFAGQANAFLGVNAPGTILVVLLKGTLAGFIPGVVYRAIAGVNGAGNKTVAVIVAAVLAPVVNTLVFLIGAYAFFLPTITEWAGEGANVTTFIFVGLIGVNFLIELGINLVLNTVIVRLIQVGQTPRARI